MSWSIAIPLQHRGEPLGDVAVHCRALADEECEISRRLILRAQLAGMKSAGELLDHVEQLEPGQRRELLDDVRRELELPSTAEIDEERERVYRQEHIGHVRRSGFSVLDRELPPHLRGNGLGAP